MHHCIGLYLLKCHGKLMNDGDFAVEIVLITLFEFKYDSKWTDNA